MKSKRRRHCEKKELNNKSIKISSDIISDISKSQLEQLQQWHFASSIQAMNQTLTLISQISSNLCLYGWPLIHLKIKSWILYSFCHADECTFWFKTEFSHAEFKSSQKTINLSDHIDHNSKRDSKAIYFWNFEMKKLLFG